MQITCTGGTRGKTGLSRLTNLCSFHYSDLTPVAQKLKILLRLASLSLAAVSTLSGKVMRKTNSSRLKKKAEKPDPVLAAVDTKT